MGVRNWGFKRILTSPVRLAVLVWQNCSQAELVSFSTSAVQLQRYIRGYIARRKHLPILHEHREQRKRLEEAARAKVIAEETAAAARAEAAARAKQAQLDAARAREERRRQKAQRARAKKIAAERIRQEKAEKAIALTKARQEVGKPVTSLHHDFGGR